VVAVAGVLGAAAWLSQDRGVPVSAPVPAAPVLSVAPEEKPAPPPSAPATTSAAPLPAETMAAPPPTAAPAAPFDATAASAARTMLRRAAATRDWVHANEAFFALADGDPASFHDATLLAPTRDVASAAAVTGGPLADRVFEVLGQRTGSDGPDILYEIVRTRGGSKAAAIAQDLLGKSDVLARATPALRITVALRNAPCPEKAGLLDRAVAEGDARTLVVMETVGAACLGRNPALAASMTALKARLRGH
jgi:serine/threonine-protein kinase